MRRTAPLLLLALGACSHEGGSPVIEARESLEREAAELLDAAGALLEAERQELATRLEDALAGAEVQAAALRARIATAAVEKRPQLEAALSDLMAKRQAAQERLAEMSDASGDAWDELKVGFSAAAEELTAAVDLAADAFEGEE